MEVILFIPVLVIAYYALKFLDGAAQKKLASNPELGGAASSLKTRWQMSEAAVVVQNLLEHSRRLGIGDEQINPPLFANELVAAMWNEMPDTFNGTLGPRPHKLATAAMSLANGFVTYEHNRAVRVSLFWALGEILKEVETKAYGFHPLDEMLFKTASKVILDEGRKLEATSVIAST